MAPLHTQPKYRLPMKSVVCAPVMNMYMCALGLNAQTTDTVTSSATSHLGDYAI